ncbi:MAG: hypothetical protein H6709_14505 [Kofleriaceae bacterium]|nr:hypothetical protein [Kofleriaceae bacterium]MCB9573289.1 hypothetical protein [Kofleriaceae bacterium]
MRAVLRAVLFTTCVLALAAGGAACGGDDDGGGIDAAPTDGAATVDATAADAPAACVLPATITDCTDDTPCQALCGDAYCYTFNQVGTLCTQPCGVADDCPSGWSCNNMGRCRPPG